MNIRTHNFAAEPHATPVYQDGAFAAKLAPVRWISSGLFSTERSLDCRSIQGLMRPGYAAKLFIFRQCKFPLSFKNNKIDSLLKVVMDSAAGSEYSRQCIPLASRPHLVNDAVSEWLQLLKARPPAFSSRANTIRKKIFHSVPEFFRHSIAVETFCHINIDSTADLDIGILQIYLVISMVFRMLYQPASESGGIYRFKIDKFGSVTTF